MVICGAVGGGVYFCYEDAVLPLLLIATMGAAVNPKTDYI